MRLFFILALLSYSFSGSAQIKEEIKTEIDKIIKYDTEVNTERTPGFIISVIVGDSIFNYQYGSISKDSLHKPTNSTLFEIGGLTKVFTAALLEKMVLQGKMSYDATLNEYLPEVYRNTYGKDITMEQLATHTSGLPRMPLEFGVKEKEDNNPYAHYNKKDLLNFYKKFIPTEDKPDYFYSHVNYALIELAIESVCQVPFDKLLIDEILRPLGLDDTRIKITPDQCKRISQGYSIAGLKTPYWTFQSFQGSEGLKSTTQDLVDFINFNINSDQNELGEVLTNIQKSQVKTKLTKQSYAGKGWHVLKNKRYHDVVLHTGQTSGHRTFAGFVKETQTGVVILSNSEYGMGGLGYLILKMINFNWKKQKNKK